MATLDAGVAISFLCPDFLSGEGCGVFATL
jgi:hypothetical protein